jgi:hypothetical protein
MLLISCEACFALGAIGFGIAMVWIGENRQNDDDRGAIALIFINITDVSKSYLLPISRIFGSALIASGLVYLFQVMRMVKCTNRMFGIADKEHRQKESVWKDAMFISDVRRIVTVAALQFVLHMAAGQRLGEYLILDLQNIALVFICLLAARANSRDMTHGYEPNQSARIKKNRRMRVIAVLVYAALLFSVAPAIFRWLDYQESNKGAGSDLKKSTELLVCQILFTCTYYLLCMGMAADSLRIWENFKHSTWDLYIIQIVTFPVSLICVAMQYIMNRYVMERVFLLLIDSAELFAIPALLYVAITNRMTSESALV